MHAPLHQPDQSQEVHHTWRGGSNGSHYFRAGYAQRLIEDYNATGNQESLNRLLEHVEPLAKSILEYRCTTKHESIDELLSRIRIKLWRSVRLYDASRGSAFSFCARVIASVSASTVAQSWAHADHYCELDENDALAIAGNCDALASSQAMADLIARVRMVRTPCTEPDELAAQRWLVESFIDCEFWIKRHQASDAMSEVYGLDHGRSRQLFDLTLTAVRRELIAERCLHPIPAKSLLGTKSRALIRYARYCSPEEFTRLATLLRDVAPSVIFSIYPANAAAMRRGEPEAIGVNLQLVLYGAPDDRRLFG